MLILQIYSDKLKKHLLCLKKKTKHFIAILNVAAVQHPKSVLTFEEFSDTSKMRTESLGK